MSKIPYTLEQMEEAFLYLYDYHIVYDPNPDPRKEAESAWNMLEGWVQREITEYFNRPDGVQ